MLSRFNCRSRSRIEQKLRALNKLTLLAVFLALVSGRQGTAAQLQLPPVPHFEITIPPWSAPAPLTPAPSVTPLHQPDNEPGQQQAPPDNHGTQQIPLIKKELTRERTPEDTKHRQEKAELDRELTAYTNDLARYTKRLFLATCVLAAVTGGLATAAFLQIHVGRIAIGRQLRAYVYVADASILHANSEYRPNIRITFKNFGQTPAYEVRNTSRFIVVRTENAEHFVPEEEVTVTSHRSDVGPSQDKSTTLVISRPVWDIQRQMILSRNEIGVAYGEITYFDAFQNRASAQPRFTRYRFQIPVDDEGITDGPLVFSEEGNESS
jgi:hypothetical protein